MALTLLEQETIITFNNAEAEAEIYTFSPTLIRVFSKFAAKHPDLCKHTEPKTEMHAHIFVLDRRNLRVVPKRILSDEELAMRRESARNLATASASAKTKQAQKGE